MSDPTQQHCLELFACPPTAAAMNEADRRRATDAATKSSPKFEPNANAHKAEISLVDEALVVCVLMMLVGGPLGLLALGGMLLAAGTWVSCASWLLVRAASFDASRPHPNSTIAHPGMTLT